MPNRPLLAALTLILSAPLARAADLTVSRDLPPAPDALSLAGTAVRVDPAAAAVVHASARLLADDLSRVTGQTSAVDPAATGNRSVPVLILVGTLGDGGEADQLATAGKVDVGGVRGQWETFAWQIVEHPSPAVDRALVIVGSDRRGTAYGCTELSRAIGVSPWSWWADVPTPKHAQLSVSPGRHVDGPPGVKYRGIFINDEDFGLRPWAHQTFDPELKRTEVGPKTYAKVFELMLRLRLNYLWPAMHPGSGEFGSIPGNAEMADHWGVVMGASHCEPMLRNNVYWPKADGAWRYDTNGAKILNYWAESAEARGPFEAVWTLGIRGIHDSQMDGPKGTPARVKMVEGLIDDQRKLIDAKVTKAYGPPAQVLVPYKEVLPLYDAGMKVPDDVTLMWPDDNQGYIRHLPDAAERKRSGGNGIYYHVSYWGWPHSYLWVESISPGLIWEELRKAYDNDAGRMWVVNVGDVKPAEVAIDFYSKLAWAPKSWGPDAQDQFLRSFTTDTFGPAAAGPVFDVESAYYRLASRRKPEHFFWGRQDPKGTVEWLDGMSTGLVADLARRYDALLTTEQAAADAVPADRRDAYFEMVGYAVRALGLSGRLYTGEALAARGIDAAANHGRAVAAMAAIRADADRYNDQVAGGKWRHMMSTTPEGMTWPKSVGGTRDAGPMPAHVPGDPKGVLVDAAVAAVAPAADATWAPVAGLGRTGRSLTVVPPTAFAGVGPSLTYAFDLPAAVDGAAVRLRVLPTMRVNPSGHLRLSAKLDDAAAAEYAVPGGEASDENSGPRRNGVQSNSVEIALPPMALKDGRHTLTVTAVDPGVVLDQVELPPGAKLASK